MIVKGKLLKKSPYTVTDQTKAKGFRINLNEHCKLEKGDQVYQYLSDEGIILLIPEKKISQFMKENGNPLEPVKKAK